MVNRIRFSGKEISHLIISVFIMSSLVAINMVAGAGNFLTGKGFSFESFLISVLFFIPFATIIIVPAFVLHEMGHKFTAQKFGFWAEYRMWTQGLLLAILITVLTRGQFLFIAPGAVYFAPHGFLTTAAKEKIGKIGLSGPVINLFLGVAFGLLSLLIVEELWSAIFAIGASANAFLAIFNLIPFAPLDGEKIFVWDKRIWASTIILAILLFIVLSPL